jgi:hypothetical protein
VSGSTWATIADLATALGTLVLAVATFSAVRSANLTARVAQQSLLIGLRPVLLSSRREDPALKVNYGDRKWVLIPGGGAVGEVGGGDGTMGPADGVVYMAVGLRNAGSGIAVLHGWHFYPDWHRDSEHAPLEEFEPQTRDLYIPSGDIGFRQAAFRDMTDPRYEAARKVIEAREPWTVELLYGDHEGGQRAITRFTMLPGRSPMADSADSIASLAASDPTAAAAPAAPAAKERGWYASMSRHWNVDRPDPR